MKKTIQREALYELVWTTPMRKLCQEFNISDRGLAKICERMWTSRAGLLLLHFLLLSTSKKYICSYVQNFNLTILVTFIEGTFLLG